MPVTFLVNRNVQGLPQFASNLVTTTAVTTTAYQTIADSAGNIYTCGSYISGAGATVGVPNAVQGGAPSNSSVVLPIGNATGANATAYVIKYSSTGTPLWVWTPCAPATGQTSVAYNIALDSSGQNIYVTCSITTGGTNVALYNTATSGGSLAASTITISAIITGHVLVCKIPTAVAGAPLVWATLIEGTNAGPDIEIDYGLAIDPSGSLYACGTIQQTASLQAVRLFQAVSTGDILASTVTITIPTAIMAQNIIPYLVKYSSAGVPAWYSLLKDTSGAALGSTSTANTAQNVACDPTGAFVYMVGSYFTTATTPVNVLNGSTGTATGSGISLPATTSPAQSAGYIVKYSTVSGTVLNVASIGSGTGSSPTQTASASTTTYGVTVAPSNGNVYVCGQYQASSAVLGISNSNGTTGTVTASTVALPITGANLTGYMVKFLPSLVPIYASAIPNTTGTSPNSYMYGVAVDSSDVNVFVATRYVSGSTGTAYLGVVSNITTTAATGTTGVILPNQGTAANTNYSIIRYFLNNAVYADTMQMTTAVALTTPMNITIDPTNTSVYLSASYISSTVAMTIYNAITNAITQTLTTSGVSLPISTTATSAFFLKMS